ncbi:MAG: putative rane-anchored protein [Bradyrhizobium sp.]|nr:putative rane-anchored protein [Bradyrhizobium sp.]
MSELRPAAPSASQPAGAMHTTSDPVLSKVPEVALIFWLIKILATTLGETGGDAVSMSMNLGYAVSSIIFIGIFIVAVIAQIAAKTFHPLLYWFVIIATTTAGTTMADFADRSLGVGYTGGSSILFVLLMASLAIWYRSAGSVSVNTVVSPKIEMFYWVTILFSQTLGTALGDWIADTNELGYEGGALVFGAGLVVLLAAYFFTNVSRTFLFWSAFILTRPLGATLGDLLDKPVADGGLAVSRFYASAILVALIVACILILPQKAGTHPGEREQEAS